MKAGVNKTASQAVRALRKGAVAAILCSVVRPGLLLNPQPLLLCAGELISILRPPRGAILPPLSDAQKAAIPVLQKARQGTATVVYQRCAWAGAAHSGVGVRVWLPRFLEPLVHHSTVHAPPGPTSAALQHALAGAWATWTLPAWHAGSPTSTITLRSTLWVGALPELQQSRMLYLPCPVGCTPWPAFTGSANPRDVGRYAACLKSPTAAASCRRPSQGALPRWPAVRRLRARLVRGLHL